MLKNEINNFDRKTRNKNWHISIAIIVMSLVFALSGHGSTIWIERQKIIAQDGAASDNFGWPVYIMGDYAIAGAWWDDDKGTNSGSVYIYKRNGETWNFQQKLIASDGDAYDYFGLAISTNIDFAIVGSAYDDDKGYDSGSVYVFKRDDANWTEHQKLTASDSNSGDHFGDSVNISSDYMLIGAIFDDNKGTDSGSVYVFKRDATSWVEQQILTAPDANDNDLFGNSVSISGDFAIVGAYRNDDKGTNSGAAYIFKFDGTSWRYQAKLSASDGAAEDRFGNSVSINGDYAIVGADWDDDKGDYSGSAYVFRWNGIAWNQEQKLTASDGSAYSSFGGSVSINGDWAIVGADGGKGNVIGSGTAYIFKRDGVKWIQQAKLCASDGSAGDNFGISVSISDDSAIVGACFDDDKGTDSGSAYIFEKFCPRADLNDDCKVDFADVAVLADWWLYGTD